MRFDAKSKFFWGVNALVTPRSGQISALDGLRSIAILMVVAYYSKLDLIGTGAVFNEQAWSNAVGYGWVGVDLFFVLSGFLIGKMLFQELKTKDSIQIFPFILRRGFRIWPLYYFMCLGALGFMAITSGFPSITSILPDFLFLTNYTGEYLVYGSWSLSVEEQFYILLPFFLLLLYRTSKRFIRPLFSFLWIGLLCAPALRAWVWEMKFHPPWEPLSFQWEVIHNYIFTHYDSLAIGVLLAALKTFEVALPFFFWGIAILVAAVLTFFYKTFFIYSLVALLFGVMVWYCVDHPTARLSKMLSWRGFQVVSRLSYGMYLWYRIPLWRVSNQVLTLFPEQPVALQYLLVFSVTVGFTLVLAFVTFILIEYPFLAIRARWMESTDRIESSPAELLNARRLTI